LEAVQSLGKTYPFFGGLCYSLLFFHYSSGVLSPSAAIPILEALARSNDAYAITLILPLLIPFVEILFCSRFLRYPLMDLVLPIVHLLETHSSCTDLEQFADDHKRYRCEMKESVRHQTVESEHPYHDNSDIIEHYDFPGAVKLSIVFDRETETETWSDYLCIFRDREMIQPITGRLSGPYRTFAAAHLTCWGSHLTFRFVSDASIHYWGYRATITAAYTIAPAYLSPPPCWELSSFFLRTFLEICATVKKVVIPRIIFEEELPAQTEQLETGERLVTHFNAVAHQMLLQATRNFDPAAVEMLATCPRSFLEHMQTLTPDVRSRIAQFLLLHSAAIPEDAYFALVAILIDVQFDAHAIAEQC
jgi:hypothetical protein